MKVVSSRFLNIVEVMCGFNKYVNLKFLIIHFVTESFALFVRIFPLFMCIKKNAIEERQQEGSKINVLRFLHFTKCNFPIFICLVSFK